MPSSTVAVVLDNKGCNMSLSIVVTVITADVSLLKVLVIRTVSLTVLASSIALIVTVCASGSN